MLILSPAYGRDYKSIAEAKADFLSGKDFVVHGPLLRATYLSKRDLPRNKSTQIEMRFSRLRKVGMFTYNPEEIANEAR